MRAKDIHHAARLAERLRGAYADRKAWESLEAITSAKLQIETDELWDEVSIEITPELVALGRAAREATIADLEQQLDALGVKDLWSLAEEDEDDDDEEDDDELEAAAA